jgi:cytochrome c-type biogenesis protein CcmH
VTTPGFWVAAALFAAVAVGFLLVPLWRVRRRDGHWSISGLVTSIAIVPVTIAVYFGISTWREDVPQVPPEQAAMVQQLADRMAENPGDVEGWMLLGRSYMALGQYRAAREAFTEAWQRSPVKSPELKLSFAESLIFTERASLGSDAAVLIEEVLNAEPRNQKALWYGGLVAIERGREDLACSRWGTLLGTSTPDEIATLLRRQMAALSCTEASGGGAEGEAAVGPMITLRVQVADRLSVDSFGPNASLFILARPPDVVRPVAVIRRPVNAVPGEFTLSNQDAMLGQSLADFPELTLVARISAGGTAETRSGDFFGEAVYRQGDTGVVEIVIDQVVP